MHCLAAESSRAVYSSPSAGPPTGASPAAKYTEMTRAKKLAYLEQARVKRLENELAAGKKAV